MKKNLKAPERKNKILSSLQDLIIKKQFSKLTTKEMAKHVGVSEALIFKHFKNKEDIYQQIKESILNELNFPFIALKELKDENPVKAIIYIVALIFYSMNDLLEKEVSKRAKGINYIINNIEIGDNILIRKILEKYLKPYLDFFNECFSEINSLEKVNKDNSQLLFVYYLSNHISSYHFSFEKIFRKGNKKKFIEDAILFSLRGIGIQQKDIDTFFLPKEIQKKFKKII